MSRGKAAIPTPPNIQKKNQEINDINPIVYTGNETFISKVVSAETHPVVSKEVESDAVMFIIEQFTVLIGI